MVAGFAQSGPNHRLMQLAAAELRRRRRERPVLDLGCGAGRNAVPLAALGWRVLGIDSSAPMLEAARARIAGAPPGGSAWLIRAAMDRIPARERAFDLLVAHGIWNLARSGSEMRRAIAEAARVAAPGATLFVFTFSRATLPADARPVAGEAFVFTQFSGEPQCFLTAAELEDELAAAGFRKRPDEPLLELNRQAGRELRARAAPVIHEGVFEREA